MSGGSLHVSRPAGYAREAIVASVTIAAILSGVVLRWFHLGRQSLWLDEGNTEYVSRLSPGDIVRFLARFDVHPPLYFLLEHYWRALFGSSEFALRALSALSGTLSFPVFYLLARRVLRDRMAVALAMWLFAFSVLQVWYSQEARAYELTSFLLLVALYALVVFLEKRSAVLFATILLSLAASMYMQHMMVFYLLALNVVWLTYPSGGALTQRVREVILVDVLAAILYLPWVPTLLRQIELVHIQRQVVLGITWAPRPTVGTLFLIGAVVVGFNLDYLAAVAARLSPFSAHTVWVCVVGGACLLTAALIAGGFWRMARAEKTRNASLLSYCLVPILAVFALSRITTPVFVERIFIGCSAVFPIVFACPVAAQRGRAKIRILYSCLGILLAAATALSVFGFLRYQQKENYRGANSFLLGIPESNRLIVFLTGSDKDLFDYYSQRLPAAVPGVTRTALRWSFLERLPRPQGQQIDAIDVDRLRLWLARNYSEVDLVQSNPRNDPNKLILDYMDRVLVRQDEQWFTGIRIIRYIPPRR